VTSLLVSTYSAGAPTLVFQNAAEPIPWTVVPRNATLLAANAALSASPCLLLSGINACSTANPFATEA
jgi:hypothetical protein